MAARIVKVSQIGRAETGRAQIEAIFFANAATQIFPSAEERDAYRDLWLDRYLRLFPQWCFAALDEGGNAVGYLAGSPLSDVAPLPGPDYYASFDPAVIDAHPAHLHVNVERHWRGRSIGAQLVRAFRAQCSQSGVAGLHAVTASGSPAEAFFQRSGLEPTATSVWRGREIVLLAADTSGGGL